MLNLIDQSLAEKLPMNQFRVNLINPLGARVFGKTHFDIKISKACGLKEVKDRDLL